MKSLRWLIEVNTTIATTAALAGLPAGPSAGAPRARAVRAAH